jgi:hypothetical protein
MLVVPTAGMAMMSGLRHFLSGLAVDFRRLKVRVEIMVRLVTVL